MNKSSLNQTGTNKLFILNQTRTNKSFLYFARNRKFVLCVKLILEKWNDAICSNLFLNWNDNLRWSLRK